MARKKRKNQNSNREKVINELLTSLSEEKDAEADIETNIANLGIQSEEASAEAPKPHKKHRFFFAFAIIIIAMAIVGMVSSVVFLVEKISGAVNSNSLKEEFTRFLLPVVANDIAPFENENELSNSAKINCAIWNIMLNHDTSTYKLAETGEFLIPEYDVEYSCKELFGTSSGLLHRSVGSSDMSFDYNSENHVYSCTKDLRYLSYAPVITEISQSNGIYTLNVEYYPPATRFLSENMGIEAKAEKSMKYVINRYDGKNTLVAVQFTTEVVVS